jgi:septation ring formation regulator EzrA
VTIFNPDSWMDVFTILAVSAMVAIPSWFAARNHKSIKKVTDQVVNGHTTPMRADLDSMKATLDEIHTDMRGVKTDISDIRNELRQERKDRIDLDDRFERYKKTS